MTIELPKDAAGREIPLDTTKLFGASGNAYNITRWIYTTDFYASNDVFERIADLIDRGECENEMGACDNGFECSVCGCRVEDEEHYHVSGTWNFCLQCGRKVVNHAY